MSSHLHISRSPNAKRSVITGVPKPPAGFDDAGYGRIVKFKEPSTLGAIYDLIIASLGIAAVSIAIPQDIPLDQGRSITISSIGICAGSGGSLLNGLDVDLLFTGELSHHEALAAIEQGKCVITTFHSNTERGFLEQVMKEKLRPVIAECASAEELPKTLRSELADFDIVVSKVDRDPYQIAVKGQGGW